MPIIKVGQVVTRTSPLNFDEFLQTAVVRGDQFAICGIDRLKQIQFDPSLQTTNTVMTLKSPAVAANTIITLPASTGTLPTTAFSIIQPDSGTSPTATGAASTLTLAGDGTITTVGNSGTNTATISLGTVPISKGGTNNTTAYTAKSIIFSDGTKLTQNNSRLSWDNTNKRLGINTGTPGYTVDIEDDGTGVSEMRMNGNSYAKFSFRSNIAGPDQKAWQMYAGPSGNFHFGKLNDLENFEQTIFDIFTNQVNGGPYVMSMQYAQPRMSFGASAYPAAQMEVTNNTYGNAGSEISDDGSGNISVTQGIGLFTQQLAPGFAVQSINTGLIATVVNVIDDDNFTASNTFASPLGQGDSLVIYPNPLKVNSSLTGTSSIYVPASGRVLINTDTDNGTNALQIAGSISADSGKIVSNGSGVVSKYNNISTVTSGIPSLYAQANLTTQGAAIGATTIYAVPSSGLYRISYVASITRAANISSVLGGTNGFQIIYTDADDSVVKTSVDAAINSSLNTTATSVSGTLIANSKASTNLQYSFGYTSSGTTSMQYNLHVRVEAI